MLATAEDIDEPCKMFDTAARSVVKVLAGKLEVKAAASWGAVGGEVLAGGALLEEGGTGLDEAGPVALFAGALLELAGDWEAEEEEGAEDEAAAGTALPFPPPTTQPGTRSKGVAFAGPLVTATQPGKFFNKLPGSTIS